MRSVPESVQNVLKTLTAAGEEAWCVGGCVRDLLLGREPDDWDVTTSARPEKTMTLFGSHAVPTGLQHGTVTVKLDGLPVEVTTFRCDGTYRDHRHPDHVTFSGSLEEDLARRDFTVNAIAMSAEGTLRDPFFGQNDMKNRVLRCVREPDLRFSEDALRILRCLRFAAVLGFTVDPETDRSLHRCREELRLIAAERIRVELLKLLCGKNAEQVLRAYPDVLGVFIPEILPAVGLNQRNRHHCYDVWEHIIHSVQAVDPDPVLRMTMLLHDLGKPCCMTLDEQGCGHFRGHPVISEQLAGDILRRLRFDHASETAILTLVRNHDKVIPRTSAGVRRALADFGETRLRQLFAVKRADNLAQAPESRAFMQAEIDRAEQILNEILAQKECCSLRQLAVRGQDLLALGFHGPELGKMLDSLLNAVVEGELPNDRGSLLEAAKKKEIPN